MSYREKKSRKKFIGGLPQTICRTKVCGRPHPADVKIACHAHKNKNFEKNGTYIKDSSVLSMPINFFDDPTTFGDRISQKPKKAIFVECRPAVNMPTAFSSFWLLILSQLASYAGILMIKGQFKVPCKKIRPKSNFA